MKQRARLSTAVGLLLLGMVLFLAFFFSSEAVSRDRFDQVTVGMTEAQVQEIIGAPRRIWHDASHSATYSYSTAYYYGGFPRWCVMEVFFGPDRRVILRNHDH